MWRQIIRLYDSLFLNISNNTMPVATETLSEAIFPFSGILALKSAIVRHAFEIPLSSDPTMIAIGPISDVS